MVRRSPDKFPKKFLQEILGQWAKMGQKNHRESHNFPWFFLGRAQPAKSLATDFFAVFFGENQDERTKAVGLGRGKPSKLDMVQLPSRCGKSKQPTMIFIYFAFLESIPWTTGCSKPWFSTRPWFSGTGGRFSLRSLADGLTVKTSRKVLAGEESGVLRNGAVVAKPLLVDDSWRLYYATCGYSYD